MPGKNKEKGLFRVVLYFNEKEFTAIADIATKLEYRSVYIPIKKQKPHGLANEWIANTKGIGPTLKSLIKYYQDTASERAEKLAEKLAEKKRIDDELAKLSK